MNLNILKEALQAIFPDKKSYIIAILLIIISGFIITNLIRSSKDEIEEEIEVVEEEIQIERLEDVKLQKDVQANEEQIKALWGTLNRLQIQLNDHKEAKRH